MRFDYNVPGARIETFLVHDPVLHGLRGSFDVAISISSFEHDGLGRFSICLCSCCRRQFVCHVLAPRPIRTFPRVSHLLPCMMHVTSAVRYGDPINVDGDLTAMATMRSFLKPDGVAIVAVPVSRTPRYVQRRSPWLTRTWRAGGR